MLGPMDDDENTYIAKICRCINACENRLPNSTCTLKEDAKCYRKLELVDGYEVETAGCLSSLNIHIDQCNPEANPDFANPTDFKCCWDRDLCNDHLQMNIRDDDDEHNGVPLDTNIKVALIISVSLAFLLAVFLIAICCIRFKRREKQKKRQIDAENDTFGIPSKKIGDLVAEYTTPGCSSGSGMPLLVQRTIARQIEITKKLGSGRYGTVKLGKWRDELVAVKIFNTTDEDSWFRETEIYQTVLLRHENILCFIASDINGTGSWTQLYLITDYHENGSLYDYLQNRSLDIKSALKLAHSAASGLAHLHTEILGTQGKMANQDMQGKPAIAHRDIKSKNILVKKDGACCIADMGLAVRFTSTPEKLDKGNYERSCRQGTIRYMSPEVLNETLVKDSFEAFKASDVYSFALVLWEILNCTVLNGSKVEYQLPYHDVVRNDPDFEDMHTVLNHKPEIRPVVEEVYKNHPVLSRYVEMMTECWNKRSESRLTMLRVRKTLGSLFHGPSEKQLMHNDQKATFNSGFTYSSSRSNTSEYPNQYTHNSNYIYRPPYDQTPDKNMHHLPTDGYYHNGNSQGHNGDSASPLITNGYSDSC
uniref:Serine/threonine-protein kinase receptor n=1 Tax=Halocynthia roretzi TaxID=7729 RepID=Q8T8C6_HALRO|nr:HrBMPR [Halocynthia roretzi]